MKITPLDDGAARGDPVHDFQVEAILGGDGDERRVILRPCAGDHAQEQDGVSERPSPSPVLHAVPRSDGEGRKSILIYILPYPSAICPGLRH